MMKTNFLRKFFMRLASQINQLINVLFLLISVFGLMIFSQIPIQANPLDNRRSSKLKIADNKIALSPNDQHKTNGQTHRADQEFAIKSEVKLLNAKDFPTAESLLLNNYITEGNLSRLNGIFAKAEKGTKLVIGTLGGSITAGAVCSNPNSRYSNVVLSWWKKTFPKSEFELVNAGIGATGSDYGSMRLKRDLLSKSPDFVVVDYAVNDENTLDYAKSYEGVVRQILNASQKPALLLLFMMREDGTNAQEWESKVGVHYCLPMVSYRDALWPEIKTGQLLWEQISPDKIHPNEVGHILTGELINMMLEKAYKKFSSGNIPTASSIIQKPLFTDSFEFTSIIDGEDLIPITNKNWVFDRTQQVAIGWKSSFPGSELEFEISGREIYLSCWKIYGPMGMISASIDGGSPVLIDAWFDQTWGGKRYMVPIGKNLSSGKHIVHIELLHERNTQSTGNEFRVLCLGSAGITK